MGSENQILINNSILYRCSQKFYDKQLSGYGIGAGQVLFLIQVYENEGITMYNLARKGFFDKGTVTKGIQKLEDCGYIRSEPDEKDKRMKCLYTTKKAKELVAKVYLIRREWWECLTKNMKIEDADYFGELQEKITKNALHYTEDAENSIKFFGLQKLTLLDYPGKMACTIFTGGCNFRCPFCQNSDLVFLPENTVEISFSNILQFLKKRVHILEGVCVSGGETLLQEHLGDYLQKIKELGFQIKIDTNGSFPKRLKTLVKEGFVDYVAMDIKNAPSRYGETVGVETFDLAPIQESMEYLKSGAVPYEFRTTIVKELHTEKEIREIGAWIHGADAYYLQKFEDNGHNIKQGLTACDNETMEWFQEILKKDISNTQIRGM